MPNRTNNISSAVFLLGAGASIPAGVPGTFSFVDEFVSHINKTNDVSSINSLSEIIRVLKNWKGTIDIEVLLETLTKLADKQNDPILKFYKDGQFILQGYPEKAPLIELLKIFIRDRAVITPSQDLSYLKPFQGFLEEYGTLDIISFNYDTCIEQFCSKYGRRYKDGFDEEFSPLSFDREDTDIRLYKLHGSAIWYSSDRGTYIKVPVITDNTNPRLFSGEQLNNLMLYPMQKTDYSEPFLELLMRARNVLQSARCKYLISVGYSFRDEYVTKLIKDVANRNRELTVILLDPKAYQIYHDKLQYYQNGIPSPLDGRVVCLPYKFEEIFPELQRHYLQNLVSGNKTYFSLLASDSMGNQPDWNISLVTLSNAEYVQRVKYILENKLENDFINPSYTYQYIEVSIKTALNLIAGGETATFWNDITKKLIKETIFRIMNVSIAQDRQGVASMQIQGNFAELVYILQQCNKYTESRAKMSFKSSIISEQLEYLPLICNYLETLQKTYFPVKDIFDKRRIFITDTNRSIIESCVSIFNTRNNEENIATLSKTLKDIEFSYITNLIDN